VIVGIEVIEGIEGIEVIEVIEVIERNVRIGPSIAS